jgi:hypothetical protein
VAAVVGLGLLPGLAVPALVVTVVRMLTVLTLPQLTGAAAVVVLVTQQFPGLAVMVLLVL